VLEFFGKTVFMNQTQKILVAFLVCRFMSILNDDADTNAELKRTMDVNFMGTLYCTRAAYKSMHNRGDYGYIININGVSGHYVPLPTPELGSYNTYAASKYAITATTEVLRQELTWADNKKIRVGSLSPGEVRTDMVEVAGYKGTADEYYEANPPLDTENIAAGVIFMLTLPYKVQVTELTMRPVGEKV
jgi:NADP-dependent 3-hydroxy acid dehydrogenase YdfG